MHTEAFTQTLFTQTLLHADAFTHRHLYTQTLWHTDTLTQSTQKLLSRRFYTNAFTQMLFTHRSFVHKEKIAILPQFLAIDYHFVRKGCNGNPAIAIFISSVFSLWRSNLISCERVVKGLRGTTWTRTFTSVFDDRTSFRCERVARDRWKSQFYLSFWRSNLISYERVAFRAVSLALPLLPPSKEK